MTLHVLPKLFDEVFVPEQVIAELQHQAAPQQVRSWLASIPSWISIRSPRQIEVNPKLDLGEVHAIALAEELRADHLLVDEWAAREVALRRGLMSLAH